MRNLEIATMLTQKIRDIRLKNPDRFKITINSSEDKRNYYDDDDIFLTFGKKTLDNPDFDFRG